MPRNKKGEIPLLYLGEVQLWRKFMLMMVEGAPLPGAPHDSAANHST